MIASLYKTYLLVITECANTIILQSACYAVTVMESRVLWSHTGGGTVGPDK